MIKECPITHQSININLKLKCGHEFEHFAVCEWIKKKDNCPICRANVNLHDVYLEEIDEFYSSLSENEIQNVTKILSDHAVQKLITSKINFAREKSRLINFSYEFNFCKYSKQYFSLIPSDKKLINKCIGSNHFDVSIGELLFVKWLIEIDFIAFLKCHCPVVNL